MTIGLMLLSANLQAEILFNGQWENYIGTFYGDHGWQNGKPIGQPTGNGDWSDFMAFWSPAPLDNTWLFNTSTAPDRIRLEVDPTSPKGGMVARFEVRSGDHRQGKYSGERSEMYGMLGKAHKKLPVTADSGHEFYGISVKVSADWIAPQHETAQKGYTHWGSFMQLHSPNIYNSPPAIDFIAEDDFHLGMDSGELEKIVPDPKTGGTKTGRQDSKPIAFTNGNLNRGHWVQFMMDVVWASDTSGSIRIYRRDEGAKDFTKVLDLQGTPTLQFASHISTDPAQCSTCAPDNVTHYWRIGFYRSTSPDQTNVLWLGPLVRGTAFDEVASAAFGSSGNKN
jgi:hypothetical protein